MIHPNLFHAFRNRLSTNNIIIPTKLVCLLIIVHAHTVDKIKHALLHYDDDMYKLLLLQ